MIRESTANVIRRRRGMKSMDEINDGLQQPQTVQVDVPQDFRAQEQALWQPDPADVEQATVMLQEQAAPRPGSVPAQVGQQMTAASPPDNRDEEEMSAAQEADRASGLSSGLELASRQLVGGITRTPVGQSVGRAPSQVPYAQAAAKSRAERAAEVVRMKRQGAQDQRQAGVDESEAELRRARIAALAREKGMKGGDAPGELESYKAVMAQRYPAAAGQINQLSTMKGAQDLQNSLDAEAGRGTTIQAARIAAGATRDEARSVRTDTKELAAGRRNDDLTKELANEMKGRGVMKKRMAELVSTIPTSGTVPGTGVLGDAVAWFDSKAGTDFQGPEAIKVRQNIGLLMAAILREQSGATVSEQEYARAVQSGLSTKNAATTRAALKRLEGEFAITETEIRRKYPKEAIDTYEARGKSSGGAKPSPGPGYVRGKVGGKPGWINAAEDDFEAD